MDILRYFDLREPATFRNRPPKPATAGTAAAPVASQEFSLAWQIATYFILAAAVVAGRYLDLYRAGVASSFRLDWAYLLFVAIVALLAFPVVYEKAGLNKDQPVFVQIALMFSAGMGWEKIVATVMGK